MYMSIRSALALGIFIAIIIGGPMYVLFLKDEPSKPTASQSKPSAVETIPQDPVEPEFDKNKYSHDDVTSIWVVVNKQRPIDPINYAPNDLVGVGGGQLLRKDTATAFENLVAGAKTQGLIINPLSGYRSYNTQVSVYNNEVRTYGQAVADTQSARPGTSEHQTGLAIDVGGGGCGVEDCFGDTPHGKWVAANAYKYGFIVRYVPGKESITGYRAEPWHIRYVGSELAAEMHEKGVQTLEEFFGLPAAPSYL
jgi:D-alanyl-D-alanine carboxypeptidase